jgi:hypothetical protein
LTHQSLLFRSAELTLCACQYFSSLLSDASARILNVYVAMRDGLVGARIDDGVLSRPLLRRLWWRVWCDFQTGEGHVLGFEISQISLKLKYKIQFKAANYFY